MVSRLFAEKLNFTFDGFFREYGKSLFTVAEGRGAVERFAQHEEDGPLPRKQGSEACQ